MNTDGSFGAWLKQRRKTLDLTQMELADQVGCTVTTVQKIEADTRRPSKQIAERLADVLAIMPDERAAFMGHARRLITHSAAGSIAADTFIPLTNLPSHATPFLGRENELAQIANRLSDPDCRLLTLVGGGGMGKTRLATQAAASQMEGFREGVYFVSLAPVGSPTLISAAIASALQFSFYGQQDPTVQLANYLRGKQLLLIIDNYEHLLPEIGLLIDLLASAPRLKILVTSRERLNLHEEWVLQIEGLSFPGQPHNEEVNTYSAVQLFMQTAQRLQPNFSLNANQDSIIDICRVVEGMPLGIELAATWLRAIPCHQIASQIRRNLDFLATPLRNVPDRHRSLRAVFEHSWSLAPAEERSALMKLSVFRGGIDPEAAQQVAQAPIWLLAALVDKSLVRLNAAGRYDMHELLRQFAADKLRESNLTAETEYKHSQYFLEHAEEIEQRLFGPQHTILLDHLEIEHDNFRAALDWSSRAREIELGLRLAGALGWFWNRRTHWREGRAWLEKFLEAGSDAPLSIQAKAVHHLLELNNDSRNWERMAVLYETWVGLVDELENTRVKAWLLSSLGYAGSRLAKLDLEYLNEALALFTSIGDQWGMGETLSRLAGSWSTRGDFDRAEKLLQQGIRLARTAGDKSILSWLLMNMADKNWYQGKMDAQTELIIHESLKLFHELGYKHGMHLLLCQLGHIAHFWGNDARAELLFEQSLIISQQIGAGFYITTALLGRAEIFCTQLDAERGTKLLGAIAESMRLELAEKNQFDNRSGIDFERAVNTARNYLDEEAFNRAFAEGQQMSLDRAVTYALANVQDQSIRSEVFVPAEGNNQ